MLEILSLLGSATGGGLLGIAGNFLKGKAEIKGKKLDYEHERDLRKLDMDELKIEASLKNQQIKLENDGELALANVEADRAKDVAASALRQASYNADKASYGGGIVDKIRGIMRPMITIYLLVLMSYIAYQVDTIVGGVEELPSKDIWGLYENLINSIVFLATTAVTWWFGSRSTNK